MQESLSSTNPRRVIGPPGVGNSFVVVEGDRA